jgi:transposase
LRAWELKQQGWNQTERDRARALGVTEGAVSQWMKRRGEGGGVEALRKRTSAGAPPRLMNKQQRAQLKEWLARGAVAHGFRGEVWTCERVAGM